MADARTCGAVTKLASYACHWAPAGRLVGVQRNMDNASVYCSEIDVNKRKMY
jgi:hypothetical protein